MDKHTELIVDSLKKLNNYKVNLKYKTEGYRTFKDN